jgi:hypothetical protein
MPFEFTIETMVSQPEVVEKGHARLREVTPPFFHPKGKKLFRIFG